MFSLENPQTTIDKTAHGSHVTDLFPTLLPLLHFSLPPVIVAVYKTMDEERLVVEVEKYLELFEYTLLALQTISDRPWV